MFTKGVDVPDFESGLDATPRSRVEQVHGRILRDHEGKRVPIWVTIRDVYSHKCEYKFAQRLRDYRKSNAEVSLWVLGKGVKKKDYNDLIRMVENNRSRLQKKRVETNLDGQYVIVG